MSKGSGDKSAQKSGKRFTLIVIEIDDMGFITNFKSIKHGIIKDKTLDTKVKLLTSDEDKESEVEGIKQAGIR